MNTTAFLAARAWVKSACSFCSDSPCHLVTMSLDEMLKNAADSVSL